MKKTKKSTIQNKKGQTFVEFAIVLPVFMLFMLAFIQLILIIHAHFLLEYATFCAARAGIVSKCDKNHMKEAAAVALSPLYKRSTDNLDSSYQRALNSLNSELTLTIENEAALTNSLNSAASLFEIQQPNKVLKLQTNYQFPLRIPLGNKIIASLAQGFLGTSNTLKPDWYYNPSVSANPSIPLKAKCAMRITTLTNPGR